MTSPYKKDNAVLNKAKIKLDDWIAINEQFYTEQLNAYDNEWS